MIKIDKNIPLPPILHRGRKKIYPFSTMKKGESFFSIRKINTMNSVAWQAAKKLKRKFAVRSEKNGTRIWRIK